MHMLLAAVLALALAHDLDGKWAGTMDTVLPNGQTYQSFLYLDVSVDGNGGISGHVGEAEDRAWPILKGTATGTSLTFDVQAPEAVVSFQLGLQDKHLKGEGKRSRNGNVVTMKVELSRDGPVLSYLHGVTLLRQGTPKPDAPVYKEAESSLRGALEKDQKFTPALVELGRMYVESDRAAEAVPLLEKSLTLAPKYRAAYTQLAEAYKRTNQPDRAAEVSAKLQKLVDADRPAPPVK